MDRVEYLFIDAAYLKHRTNDWSKFFDNNCIDIDFSILTKGYSKIFYYDGVSDGDKEKIEYLNALREIPNFHVQTSTVKGDGKKKRQKQVDVSIAVDMLMHTIRKNMHSCTLLSGDEDFTPLLKALIQEGMNVNIWAEKKSTNKELLYAADKKIDLSIFDVWNASTQKFKEKYPPPKINISTYASRHHAMYGNPPIFNRSQK